MKKKFLNIAAIASILFFVSCDRVPSGMDFGYYVYITGETGKSVDISYLQRDAGESPRKNIIINETVTLPFFKDVRAVDFIDDEVPDCFLQIKSENDTTTKAVILDDNFFVPGLDNRKCYAVVGILTGNPDYYTENCDTCTSCRGLTQSNIFSYLKEFGYPCYLEFSKGDTLKKVRLHEYWGWE